MHDDGVKTYIDWSPETPLPAVFFIDDYGRERLANGNMRGGLYVIDSVHEELLFRIDKKKARAKRSLPKDEGSCATPRPTRRPTPPTADGCHSAGHPRSEERRVGHEGVSPVRSRRASGH